MRISTISAAAVAALVGYGSTIALILAAAAALGASPAQTSSWVLAICLVTAIGTAALSLWTRIPVILAWSTPGAALIAATHGIAFAEGVGAFLFAALLIVLTGVIRPLGRLIGALPPSIASGMLAGVLLPFCLEVPKDAAALPGLVLPVVAIFALIRLINPAYAVLAALAVGVALTFGTGTPLPAVAMALPSLQGTLPVWSLSTLIGLGLPLYLVTMASQNLPGFAVLQGAGYEPPVRKALTVTGALSGIGALFGAHTLNMAAITAAICLGDDVHPDRAKRWTVGLSYAFWWAVLGLFGPVILAGIHAVPPALIATIAGLALINPTIGALSAAFSEPRHRFAAATTLITAASGVAAFGIGAAFWGLLAGLAVHLMESLRDRLKR